LIGRDDESTTNCFTHTSFQPTSFFSLPAVSYCQEILKDSFYYSFRQNENGKEGNIQKSLKKGKQDHGEVSKAS
jgi:hypothetical protein